MSALVAAPTSCRASRVDLRGGGGGIPVDKFGCALRMGRGGEHRSVVSIQHFQPARDIGSVIFARFQSKAPDRRTGKRPQVRQPVPRQHNLRSRSDARRSHGRAGLFRLSSGCIHGQASRNNCPRLGSSRRAASGSHQPLCCKRHDFRRVGWLLPRLLRTFPRDRCGPQGTSVGAACA
jgi:hypothetical protein